MNSHAGNADVNYFGTPHSAKYHAGNPCNLFYPSNSYHFRQDVLSYIWPESFLRDQIYLDAHSLTEITFYAYELIERGSLSTQPVSPDHWPDWPLREHRTQILQGTTPLYRSLISGIILWRVDFISSRLGRTSVEGGWWDMISPKLRRKI